MKINIYPIVSSLHDKTLIENNTNELLTLLRENSNHSYNIVSIDELYNADLSLILVLSGGSENEFLTKIDKLREPYYILTYGYNNSLAASLEILSFIKDNNYSGEVLHGDVSYLVNRMEELSQIKRYGVIGKPSDWLIASNVNYSDALCHNVNLVNIDINEIIEEYNKNFDFEDLNLNLNFDKNELKNATKLYYVLKRMVFKYNLSGLTIRCFDLLSSIRTTACLALALLNKEGIVSTCEGDIPTMITMQVIKDLLDKESFQANPSQINVNDNTVVFAHCTLPLNMCKTFTLDTHFESGIGVAIKGTLKEDKITVFKLSKDLKHYFVSTGKILSNLNSNKLCRTQIKVKLDKSVNYFLTRPYGNHHVIFYGDYEKEINDYMQKLIK